MRLVVERAADVEHVGAVGRQPDPLRQVERDGGAREHGGAPVPHVGGQHRADVDRRHLEAGIAGAARRPTPRGLGDGEGGVEVDGERAGRLLGPDLALVDVDHLGRDGAQAGQHLVDAAAAGDEWRRRCRPAADRAGGGRGGAGGVPASASPAASSRPGAPSSATHPPDDAGRGRVKRPAPTAKPGRRRDDVLELVGLVEHDDVVLGQEGAAAGDVHAVEVGVDDHDVGGLRRARRAVLGEARVAERAAGRAGALLGS